MTEAATATAPVSATAKPFTPQSRVVFTNGNPAKGLKGNERAKLLKIINQTRSGQKTFVIEVTYKRISHGAPRLNGPDYQAPSGVAHNVHQGMVLNARETQEGNWILLIDDNLRRNAGQSGFTSLRLDGLRSIKEQTALPGPLARRSDAELIDII